MRKRKNRKKRGWGKPYIKKKNSLSLGKGPYLRKNKVSFGEGRKRSQREDGIVGTILLAVPALVWEIVKVFK